MRLIDADELKKCAIPCEIHNGALTDLCVPLYQIDNAPTVETKQGEWTDYSVNFWKCPECGYLLNKFCPQCYNNVILPKGGAK